MRTVDQEGVRLPAADDAVVLDHVPYALADAAQQIVSEGLAVALVDRVEVVDIQHDGVGGQILVVDVKLGGVAVEEFPVVETGQRVALRRADDVPVLRQLDGAQHAGQHHLRLGVGLGDEVDGADGEALHLCVLLRRHHNDGDADRLRVRLQLAQHVQAVHVRQIQIQQDQAQRLAVLAHCLQCVGPGGGKEQLVAVLQHAAQHLLVDHLILDDQDPPFAIAGMKCGMTVKHTVSSCRTKAS